MNVKKMPAEKGAGNQVEGFQERSRPNYTKRDAILAALRSGRGLNRFEAERLGDHCLNSTVSALRATGHAIDSSWERVPTRFNPAGVRVLRYVAHDGDGQ